MEEDGAHEMEQRAVGRDCWTGKLEGTCILQRLIKCERSAQQSANPENFH